MRTFLTAFMGLALVVGSTAVSRADDKTKIKTESNGDVKIKEKTHENGQKHKVKTKIHNSGDTTTVKTKEKVK